MADEPIREDATGGPYRLTFEDLGTGRVEILTLHPVSRRRFRIEVNGLEWRTCGWTRAIDLLRKSCVRASISR